MDAQSILDYIGQGYKNSKDTLVQKAKEPVVNNLADFAHQALQLTPLGAVKDVNNAANNYSAGNVASSLGDALLAGLTLIPGGAAVKGESKALLDVIKGGRQPATEFKEAFDTARLANNEHDVLRAQYGSAADVAPTDVLKNLPEYGSGYKNQANWTSEQKKAVTDLGNFKSSVQNDEMKKSVENILRRIMFGVE